MSVPQPLDTAFRTVFGVLVLPIALIAYSTLAILQVLRRAPREKLDRIYWSYARLCMRVGGTKLEARGLEHIRPGQAYVIVPNHESNWDPPAIVAALGKVPARFIAKRQITDIPIFGWAVTQTGSVRIKRTDTQGDAEKIRQKMADLPMDVSMIFYAEGTRSRDGALHEFKKGAFVAAIAYGLPVLPVAQAGCYRIWPPLTVRLRSGPVVVEVGRPIPIENLTYDDRDKLRDQTFEAVRALRIRARNRVRELGVDPGGID